MYYMKLGTNPTQNPVSAHLPAFECGTVTTCDDLYDECDYQLTNLVAEYKNFRKKKLSNAKKHGKGTRRVFLDVFRPPDHDPSIHLPSKNLVWALATLSIYAVMHYRVIALFKVC